MPIQLLVSLFLPFMSSSKLLQNTQHFSPNLLSLEQQRWRFSHKKTLLFCCVHTRLTPFLSLLKSNFLFLEDNSIFSANHPYFLLSLLFLHYTLPVSQFPIYNYLLHIILQWTEYEKLFHHQKNIPSCTPTTWHGKSHPHLSFSPLPCKFFFRIIIPKCCINL